MEMLTIPPEVLEAIEKYRYKAFNYRDSMTEAYQASQVDPFNPKIPGVSEEFFNYQDPTTVDYLETALEVNLYSHLHVLMKPGNTVIEALKSWANEQDPEREFYHISGHFLYPKEQGFMGWHTNSDQPNARIYLSYAEEGGKSFFRYRDPESGEIVTLWDEQGWNARMFETPRDPNKLYWHCVYSECDRSHAPDP